MNDSTLPDILISPRGMTNFGEWRELWAARDLWWFLVRRDLKTRYSQSVLGLGWAVLQPLFTTFIFTLIFGKLAGLASDGVPYNVWSLTAVVVWTYFQSAVNEAGNCLAANIGVITKVYFPRLILPMAAVAGKIFDLMIMMALLGLSLLFNHGQLLLAGCHLQISTLWVVPLGLAITTVAAQAAGLWLAALSVQYRDVRVAQGFMLQLLMYATPVIYSSSKIYAMHLHVVPESWRSIGVINSVANAIESLPWHEIYFLNPLAGVIEAMRASLFGQNPVSYAHLALGGVVALVGWVGGIWCFRRAENLVADVS